MINVSRYTLLTCVPDPVVSPNMCSGRKNGRQELYQDCKFQKWHWLCQWCLCIYLCSPDSLKFGFRCTRRLTVEFAEAVLISVMLIKIWKIVCLTNLSAIWNIYFLKSMLPNLIELSLQLCVFVFICKKSSNFLLLLLMY